MSEPIDIIDCFFVSDFNRDRKDKTLSLTAL